MGRPKENTPIQYRGIRCHFVKYLKKFSPADLIKAQLGLGHSYSRAQVQYDPNRQDKSIIQSIAVIDQLDKDINTFSMRIKEWFAWHFPELNTIVSDNLKFVKIVNLIESREGINDSLKEQITEITQDADIAQSVIDAGKSSMGQAITEADKEMLKKLSGRLTGMIEYRTAMQEYLKERIDTVTPNMGALIGENVGARLISHAGGLINLAKLPASTIQILGAEKALFRALKTRGNTPKYGLIYHSTFIGRAATQNKGRISRSLANKLAMAARIDAFGIRQTQKFGDAFRNQVEERLKFFSNGPKPRKNAEVMAEVLEELKTEGLYVEKKGKNEEAEADEVKPTPAKKKETGKAKKANKDSGVSEVFEKSAEEMEQ